MTELEIAHAAMAAGDLGEALARMLAAWRACPDEALANAIERVGERAARDVHPPAGVTAEDREASWRALAATGDPVVRQRLIETISDAADAEAQVARAEALVGARDPRLGTKLVAMLAAEKHADVRVATFWQPMFALLAKCGDPRVVAGFQAIAWGARRDAIPRGKRVAFDARLADARLLLRIDPHRPSVLAPSARAIVDAIAALATAPSAELEAERAVEATLLAAVYANPADDGPRAIYADWLQQRGDPRGEFIVLQLAADWSSPTWATSVAKQRADRLLEQHRERWLGPLAGAVVDSKFVRGFLDSCELRPIGQARAIAPPSPIWATVTSIVGGIPTTDAIPTPALAGAYRLEARDLTHLESLATLPPLTSLGWIGNAIELTAVGRVIARLPTLRYLQLEPRGQLEELAAAAVVVPWRASSIRTLRVRAGIGELGAWLDAAADSRLDDLELLGAWRIKLARASNGELGRLAIACSTGDLVRGLDQIFAVLEAQPPARITELVIDVAPYGWTQQNRTRVIRLLRDRPQLTARLVGIEYLLGSAP